MQPEIHSLSDRIAQAIAHPGSIVGRRLGPSWGEGNDGYSTEQETAPRWAARAVLAVLQAVAPHHVIKVTESGWVISHSMGCRLRGDLFTCAVNEAAGEFVPATPPGRYICDVDEDGVLVIGDEVPA